MSLPYDIARCDGFDCANKTECARFLELHNRGPNTSVMHSPLGLCKFYIAQRARQSVVSVLPAITTL